MLDLIADLPYVGMNCSDVFINDVEQTVSKLVHQNTQIPENQFSKLVIWENGSLSEVQGIYGNAIFPENELH